MFRNVPSCAFVCLIVLTAAPRGSAAETTYDFQDPKGVNGVAFVMDSELEPIVGTIGGVAGEVAFDPDKPEAIHGAVSVDMAQTSFINPAMAKALAGADWLNIEGAFLATYTFKGVEVVEGADGVGAAVRVKGTMAFGGAEVPLSTVLEASHKPGGAEKRGGGKTGDLLLLRAAFEINRLELGVKENAPADKVGESISVIVPIAGYAK